MFCRTLRKLYEWSVIRNQPFIVVTHQNELTLIYPVMSRFFISGPRLQNTNHAKWERLHCFEVLSVFILHIFGSLSMLVH